MKLSVGNIVIADSLKDGFTVAMRASNPQLNLQVASHRIVGGRYARNSSRGWGLSFGFSVSVVRQFPTYYKAEAFTLKHLASFANGLEGDLFYHSHIGKLVAFQNSALERVELKSAIGVQTEIEYFFKCGQPILQESTAITVGGVLLTVGGKVITIKI